MKLKLLRTMWGVLDFAKPEEYSWEPLFKRLKEEGYAGIEIPFGPFFPFQSNPKLAKELLQKYNLEVVGQVHTCSYPISSYKVSDHLDFFKTQVSAAKEWGVVFVNSHSGIDAWSFEESIEFFKEALKFEKEQNIKIIHETHRSRILYNPFITRDILKALPDLKINCDLSHFAVVCERVFNAPADLAYWPDLIQLLATHTHLIHMRVGYAHGPQVPDPSAKEYAIELENHEKWWDIIWEAQNSAGFEFSYVEPEHGPPPYLHTLPYTNMPVANLWDVNSWIAKRELARFNEIF